jgi:hypothetical protein
MLRSFLFLAALVVATDVAAQDTALRPGDALRASLDTGDTVRYVLDVKSDYFVRGAVDQVSVDVVVRILRPDGRVVRTIDGPDRGLERFQFETDEEGAYQIVVIAFEEETGDFVITLDRLEPVATDPKKLADQLLSAYDGDDSPGAVVSVLKDGKTFSHGRTGWRTFHMGFPSR